MVGHMSLGQKPMYLDGAVTTVDYSVNVLPVVCSSKTKAPSPVVDFAAIVKEAKDFNVKYTWERKGSSWVQTVKFTKCQNRYAAQAEQMKKSEDTAAASSPTE